MLCLFLSTLRALVTWKELFDQTTELTPSHNHIWTSEFYKTVKGFAILSVEKILTSTIDIPSNILNWFWTLFKNVNPLPKRTAKGTCLIFKRYIAHLAHRRSLRTLIIVSARRLKSLFLHEKFTRTLCIRTIQVPNEISSAIVITTIRGACTTHRNCSHLFHTCLQRIISSYRGGEFRDSWGRQFL